MKRLLVAALGSLALLAARAEEPAPAVPAEPVEEVLPLVAQGYAFDKPEILIRQRLFGLAHGVSMLAAACLDLPEHSAPIQDAYASWHTRQAEAIDRIVHDLAGHHFGKRGDEAHWQDLMRALGLKDSILPSLGSVPLKDACATLPEALSRPRYDFTALLKEADSPVKASAVAPAPVPATAPNPVPAEASPQ